MFIKNKHFWAHLVGQISVVGEVGVPLVVVESHVDAEVAAEGREASGLVMEPVDEVLRVVGPHLHI